MPPLNAAPVACACRCMSSSRGIGASIARLAARDGYDVCVTYRKNGDSAAAVVADIQARGRRAIAVKADTGQEADIVRLFETIDRDLGADL